MPLFRVGGSGLIGKGSAVTDPISLVGVVSPAYLSGGGPYALTFTSSSMLVGVAC